jgi:hypothetical protein
LFINCFFYSTRARTQVFCLLSKSPTTWTMPPVHWLFNAPTWLSHVFFTLKSLTISPPLPLADDDIASYFITKFYAIRNFISQIFFTTSSFLYSYICTCSFTLQSFLFFEWIVYSLSEVKPLKLCTNFNFFSGMGLGIVTCFSAGPIFPFLLENSYLACRYFGHYLNSEYIWHN